MLLVSEYRGGTLEGAAFVLTASEYEGGFQGTICTTVTF